MVVGILTVILLVLFMMGFPILLAVFKNVFVILLFPSL
tara:strand:- start:828 stop:941 length:114 start_codon:yes stop_codon:yes gene_type:complete